MTGRGRHPLAPFLPARRRLAKRNALPTGRGAARLTRTIGRSGEIEECDLLRAQIALGCDGRERGEHHREGFLLAELAGAQARDRGIVTGVGHEMEPAEPLHGDDGTVADRSFGCTAVPRHDLRPPSPPRPRAPGSVRRLGRHSARRGIADPTGPRIRLRHPAHIGKRRIDVRERS